MSIAIFLNSQNKIQSPLQKISIDLLPFEKCLVEKQIFLIVFLKKSLNSRSIELFFKEK